MTQILKYCFDKPWRSILFFAMAALLFTVAEILQNKAFIDFTFGLFVLGFIGLFISGIWQLKIRKPLSAILTFAVFALGVFGFFLLLTARFMIGLLLPDRYADNLTIPDNIEIHQAKEDRHTEDNSIDSLAILRKANDFELYKSFQPGLYEYDIWLGEISEGTVFLKAYEVTRNNRLSKRRLTKSSAVPVNNPTDSLKRFGTKGHFTIYEGDWGKPYAARFELWYKPKKGEEKKLTEKNYIIEGWQH